MCYLQETHFKCIDIGRLKGQKKIYCANINVRKAGVAIYNIRYSRLKSRKKKKLPETKNIAQ